MNYKYQLIEKKQDKKIIKGNLKDINGFKFIPKNEIEYDGVTVSKMLLIKPSFIEKLLKKKIKRKLDGYLKFIVEIIDDEDAGNDTEHLNHVLDDLARYKSIVNSKYKNFLEEKYVSLLLQKIQLLENELKEKLNYQNKFNKEVEEYTRGRSR